MAGAFSLAALGGCLADNPPAADGGGDSGVVDGSWLACTEPSCSILLVSQTLDDRIDAFEVPATGGEGAVWRGSLSVDLVSNPGGDISGDALDEPLGLARTEDGLEVLVGHYPSRKLGSRLRIDDAALNQLPSGEIIGVSSWWRGGNPLPGFELTALDELEPISLVSLSPGRSLAVVFNNDPFQAESTWTESARLLLVDDDGQIARLDVADLVGGACAGGWGVTWTGPTTVALACDGDEGVAILDVSGASDTSSSVQEGAASITGCFADVGFDDKRVRYVADDGEGGVITLESPSLATGEDARIWHFDAQCDLVSLGTLAGPEVWDLRQIVRIPGSEPARWLVARGRTQARGVYVVAEGSDGLEICGEVPGLTSLWSDGPEVVEPVSLAVAEDGRAFAVGAGPADYGNATPGYGVVGWVELSEGDPCVASTTVTNLTALAPTVDAALPDTWRRAPNDLFLFVGP